MGLVARDRKTVAQEIIAHLNAKADKRHSPDSVESLRLITRALIEVKDDEEGIKAMLDREVALKAGTSGEEYLQPSTLFGPEKFRERYDKRHDPLPPRGNLPVNNRNAGIPNVDAYGKKVAEAMARRKAAGQ